MTRRGPRVFFALRSPYSWIALRRLAELVPDAAERVEYIPFWEPDAVTEAALRERGAEIIYTPMSKAKHLYLLSDTKRLAAKHGYPMAWPIDVDPWWELPNLAWLLARRQGAAMPFYLALTEARWERGEDICDPAVVAAAGESVGLDGRALVAAPDDPSLRAEGVDMLAAAYDDDIFGIPYFRVGRHRYWGLDRLDLAVEALGGTFREPVSLDGIPEAVLATVGAYDRDSAGGCG